MSLKEKLVGEKTWCGSYDCHNPLYSKDLVLLPQLEMHSHSQNLSAFWTCQGTVSRKPIKVKAQAYRPTPSPELRSSEVPVVRLPRTPQGRQGRVPTHSILDTSLCLLTLWLLSVPSKRWRLPSTCFPLPRRAREVGAGPCDWISGPQSGGAVVDMSQKTVPGSISSCDGHKTTTGLNTYQHRASEYIFEH